MRQPQLDLVSTERRGAVQQAHQHLSSLLDLRRVRPGDRLPSSVQLAREIGVSRPAVLQALRQLENEGRVVVRPGRGGTWVVEHEADNLEARVMRAWTNRETIVGMAHLREILEPGVAALVAKRGMPTALRSEARRLLTEMSATSDGDNETYRSLDTEFHLLVARATEMSTIESVVTMCRREVAAAFDVMTVASDRRRTSNDEHRDILAAIEAGDAQRAAAAALLHVSAATHQLEQVLTGDRPPTARRPTAESTLRDLRRVGRRAKSQGSAGKGV